MENLVLDYSFVADPVTIQRIVRFLHDKGLEPKFLGPKKWEIDVPLEGNVDIHLAWEIAHKCLNPKQN
jgi:hypothetical protein